MLFDKWMNRGSAALNSGHTLWAAICFARAVTINPSAESWQMLGICLRMIRWFKPADFAFRNALANARTRMQRAKILRDWAMVAVRRRDYDLALKQLKRSRRLLACKGKRLVGGQRHEYYATISFMGEVCRLMGDKYRALGYLKMAYDELKGHDPYGLNALMRYMAAVPWCIPSQYIPARYDATTPDRIELAWEAWRLATAAKNRKRKIQIILLLVSVRLADRLSP